MAASDLHIAQLEFARYRCFRDAQTVDLGRLTLIYGENNTGKSAVVRLLPLLADSRLPGQTGLNARSTLLENSSLRQLPWRGALSPADDKELKLGVRFRDGTTWRWTFAVEGAERRPQLELTKIDLIDSSGRKASVAGNALLDGVVPATGQGPLVDDHRAQLLTCLEGVTWLGPSRVGPSPNGIAPLPGGRLWSDGRMAEANCFDDTNLLKAVSEFYAEHLNRRVVKEGLGSDLERLVLEPTEAAGFRTGFHDSGSGLQHLFSVIVALESLRRNGGLLIAEEPDAHLHPRLQRALAQHTVAVLLDNDEAQVLLETHSEVFLLAALDAAAPGDSHLEPDQVRLHWVEQGKDGAATIETIELDDTGRPRTPHLEQAFATMGLMRRELLRKRRQHAR